MGCRVTLREVAREHVYAAHDWWRQNRDKAPLLFAQEFAEAVSVLREAPDIGLPYTRQSIIGLRRLLMRKTNYHVYYLHFEDTCHVLAVWSASRKRGPPLKLLKP